MKIRILYTCLCFVLLSVQCRKSDLRRTDTPGLPPATQYGANTFGCLINGELFIPKGNDGTGNNLSIDYDKGFSNGIFGVSSYHLSPSKKTRLSIGVDSMNFVNNSKDFIISNPKVNCSIAIFTDDCWIYHNDNMSIKSGLFRISKYDKINGIISGTFEAELSKSGCITYKITKGRFDFKF